MRNVLNGLLICAAAFCAAAVSTPTGGANGAQRGRIMPPAGVTCDPNRLTSFTGAVTSYARSAGRVQLRMRTDEETNERFTLRFGRKESAAKYFLLNGEAFKDGDWKLIETRAGRLRRGMRATVWVCDDAPRHIIDWRPGEGPAGVHE